MALMGTLENWELERPLTDSWTLGCSSVSVSSDRSLPEQPQAVGLFQIVGPAVDPVLVVLAT